MSIVALFLLTALLSFIAGLSAALAAEAFLTQRVAIAGSFIGLTLSRNPGIAFGLRLPPVAQELLILAALAAVTVLAVRTLRGRPPGSARMAAIGYGLIIGGALANIVDRLLDGTVTDFFQVGTFPVFNVADSCITIGVVCILASGFRLQDRT